MRGLYVFTHDLRLHDNALLEHICKQCDELLCLYICDDRHYSNSYYNDMGLHRRNFLFSSLRDLENKLQALGQALLIQQGLPEDIIYSLNTEYHFDLIGIMQHPGVYEQRLIAALQTRNLPIIDTQYAEQFTLLQRKQLPFKLDDFKRSFSYFRKQVEPLLQKESISAQNEIKYLPAQLKQISYSSKANKILTSSLVSSSKFKGGESKGLEQLHYYCQPGLLDSYKQTRNGLLGWDFSSKLSPWLANGSLSVKTVWQQVNLFEAKYKANESTYWLKFELLWREYFQYLLYTQQENFFRFQGLALQAPTTSFDQTRYQLWTEGKTGYKGVDAAMQELKNTGWLSNRARQWVASCFVNELELDWRYGAAYFEQQLIDFDVASNWGNWLYLAGVGTDPRGQRQFNLQKQLDTYDPNGEFTKHYLE